MELEAPPRQTIERAAAAPVERQEAARFAGSCASNLVTLAAERQRDIIRELAQPMDPDPQFRKF